MEGLVSFLLGIPCSAYRAFVISKGWTWFILPLFGIASPNIWAIWGLMYLISLGMPGLTADAAGLQIMSDDAPAWAVGVALSLVMSTFGLGFMFILQALAF